MFGLNQNKKNVPVSKTAAQIKEDKLNDVLSKIAVVPNYNVLVEKLEEMSISLIDDMAISMGNPDRQSALAATLVHNERTISLLTRFLKA